VERISRLVLRHRRLLAALFTGLAVLLALGALRDEPTGRTVVVAARDLASGTTLVADDVQLARLPESAVPEHSEEQIDSVVGRTVAGPMRRGEVITDRRVVHPDRLSGFPAGTVLATIRLADADTLSSLGVGDRVDVVAVDPDGGAEAEVVARDVEVVTLPPPADDSDGVPVGVATTEHEALELAERVLSSRLSLLPSQR
jgi:Flp pilus assembly protein CpaB